MGTGKLQTSCKRIIILVARKKCSERWRKISDTRSSKSIRLTSFPRCFHIFEKENSILHERRVSILGKAYHLKISDPRWQVLKKGLQNHWPKCENICIRLLIKWLLLCYQIYSTIMIPTFKPNVTIAFLNEIKNELLCYLAPLCQPIQKVQL